LWIFLPTKYEDKNKSFVSFVPLWFQFISVRRKNGYYFFRGRQNVGGRRTEDNRPEVGSQRTEGFAGLKPWTTWLEADSFVAQGFIPAEASCGTARLSLQEAGRQAIKIKVTTFLII
jgi:hypothetical protein